jgi:hypothetical protein
MENQQACDSAQRQRVTIDAGTLPNVTTVGTVTTCSTVSSVTNQVATAGMNQEQYINISRNTYANSIRNKLFFS